MKILFLIIICSTFTNLYSQNKDKEYNYLYRIEMGDIEPSFFPEYSKKLSKDSIIAVELKIIYKDDIDTNKDFKFDDPRYYLRGYQDKQMIEGFEKEGKYYINISRNKNVIFKYLNTRKGKLEKELPLSTIDYVPKGYQLNKIIIEEGKRNLDIPIIESKRPLSENEISEIIKLLRTNHFKLEELEIFKDKTAILLYEIYKYGCITI